MSAISQGVFLPSDLHWLLPQLPSGEIVCVGLSSAPLALACLEYGFQVTMVELDSEKLSEGQKKYGMLDWVQADIRSMRLPRNHYSALFAPRLLTYIPNGERARLIGRFKSTVQPGGALVVGGVSSEDPRSQLKLARDLQGLTHWPTGTTSLGEMQDRFKDWVLARSFQGKIPQREAWTTQIVAYKENTSKRSSKAWQKLPFMGLGLPLSQIQSQFKPFLPLADHLLCSTQYYGEERHDIYLQHLRQRYDVLPLSYGLGQSWLQETLEPQLKSVERLCRRCQSPWVTEVLGFLPTPYAPASAALPYSSDTLEHIFDYVKAAQKTMGCAILLRNQAPLFSVDFELSWAHFWQQLDQKNRCAFDLDIIQLMIDAQHRGLPAQQLLSEFPTQKVVQITFQSHPLDARFLPLDEAHFWLEVWDLLQTQSYPALKSVVYALPTTDYLWQDILSLCQTIKPRSHQ